MVVERTAEIGKKTVNWGSYVGIFLGLMGAYQRMTKLRCGNYAYSDFLIIDKIRAKSISIISVEALTMDTQASANCSGPFASHCRLRIMLGVTVVCLVASIGTTIYIGV